jgi:hypothetical protein
METLLSRRQAPAEAAPSQVTWADPIDFRLGEVAPKSSTPVKDTGAVRTAPEIETSPVAANQPASSPPGQAIAASANIPARPDEPATRPTAFDSAMAPTGSGLGERLATRIRDYPRDVSGHLEYQLMQLLLDQQVPQLAALAALPTEDREMVSAVIDGLVMFRNTLRADNNTLLSRKIGPLLEMADRLRTQADLSIPTVALCRSVRGFGDYDAIEPARFAAMTEYKVILYCEVANFSSGLNDQQQWETVLKQEMVLYTEQGVPVWSDKTESIKDLARSRRHDFFVNKRITIPRNLTIGRYLLKVTIVDVHANRVAEASVPVVIAAQ